MLKHVDIFIESDIPPLKRQSGRYGYILAYINQNNELKTAEINIYVNSAYVAGMFASGTFAAWQQNGFISSKNKKIVDYPKWERLSALVKMHVVIVMYTPHHEYSLYLRNCIKNCKEG